MRFFVGKMTLTLEALLKRYDGIKNGRDAEAHGIKPKMKPILNQL